MKACLPLLFLLVTFISFVQDACGQCPVGSPIDHGGSICGGISSAWISVYSQNGVLYQVQRYGSDYAPTVTGTGAILKVATNVTAGSYTVIAKKVGCVSVTLFGVAEIRSTPEAGTPSMPSGVTSRCQGGGTSTYTTSASYADSYTWSVSPSAAGTASGTGTTGTITWDSNYNGTATVSVSANGCSGARASAPCSVTVEPTVTLANVVGTSPVCQGTKGAVYLASSANNATGYEWSITNGGSSTLTKNGYVALVDWSPDITSGTATISARALGCNGPTPWRSMNVVITTSVTTPPTVNSPVHTRCQGDGPSPCMASAPGASSYNWSLSPESAGTINSQGIITWDESFVGEATVRVSANGCNGTTAAASMPVTVNRVPSQPTVVQPYRVNYNDPAWLTASGASEYEGYRWYTTLTGGITLPSTYIPHLTSTTQYYVSKYSLINGCESKPRVPFVASVYHWPTVNAGPDQTIQIPVRSVTLNGSATDDGTISSYKWTQILGPTSFVWGDATGPTLTLTKLVAGTYLFFLTVKDNDGLTSADDVTVTVNFPPNNFNYVKETVALVPITISESQVFDLPIGSKSVAFNYLDGFGRALQQIQVQGSPLRKDIIRPFAYDEFGREAIQYLPYVSDGNTGNYNYNPVGAASYTGSPHFNFYTNGPADKIADDKKPFSKTVYEASPLNRVSKQGMPGEAWQPYAMPDNYLQKWNYKDFLLNGVAGGGSDVELKIQEGVLTVQFVAGFVSTPLKTGAVKLIGTNPALPDMELGLIAMGNYKVSIKASYLFIEPTGSQAVPVTGFGASSGSNVVIFTVPFSQDGTMEWDYHDFLNSPVGGGGDNVKLTIKRGTLTVKFAAGFAPTQLKTGAVKPVPNIPPIPDMYLGLIARGNYKVSIQKGYLYVEPVGASPVLVDGFGVTSGSNIVTLSATLPDAFQDRSVETNYALNKGNEVLYWNYNYLTSMPDAGSASALHYYPANTLYLKQTYDEQHHLVMEYSNDAGRVLLKRVQAGEQQAPVNDTNYASTYFVYNDLNILVCVIPPQAVSVLAAEYYQAGATDATKDAFLSQWAFRYKYDTRGRMIAKKVPGADWVYMVYDDRDRVVMTQDGEQRKANTWSFTKYDPLNQPVMTGLYTHTAPLDQAGMSALISTTSFYETYNGDAATHGYTNITFPTTNTEVLTVTYYDNYSFKTLINDTQYNYKSDEFTDQYKNTNGDSFLRITGLVAGTKTKIIGTGTYLWSLNYFDDQYRVAQNIATNARGGIDRTTNVYDFVGKVMKTKTVHNFNATPQTVSHTFDYDHAGRLLKTSHNVNGATPVLLAQNEYNELGQLIDKKLHSEDNGSTFKQSIDYRYNIRNWLTSVNDVTTPESTDLFSMNLNYHTPTANGGPAQYNGNISEIRWRGCDAKTNSYGYSYDPMNRLIEAKYYDADVLKNGRYNEKIGLYDLNSNIKLLTRTGKTGINAIGITTYGQMDDIAYTYQGNKLLRVTETGLGVKTEGFIDGTNTDDDYAYDANGNMNLDKNKGITGASTAAGNSNITYNYLNLPEKVIKSTGDYEKYTYDATGRKLRQEVYTPANVLKKKTDYAGEFFYENDTLKFISHEEGRITMTGAQPEYQYHLKDHLGNVRVTFTTVPQTEAGTATLEDYNEDEERSKFLRYDNVRKVFSDLVDHTNPDFQIGFSDPDEIYGGNAMRLSGGANEKFGLARSLSVMPGDVINMEVYAKYVDPAANQNNFGEALTTLLSYLAAPATAPAGTIVDGLGYATSTATFPASYQGLLDKSSSTGGPKAYLNYMIFDRNFNFKNGGYVRMGTTAKEDGSNVPHELLSSSITITESGYVYIYLSNEEMTPVECYFDDFKVEQIKSPVIASNDYYPFGLQTSNSYTREGGVKQDYLYNGKEIQDELDLGWLDYGQRMYDPACACWHAIDPMAHKMPNSSPYSYAFNNPVRFIDIDGLIPYPITIRAFAPFITFGRGFHGDDRGYSTANTTARVHQKINFDTDKTTLKTNAWSSPSSHIGLPGIEMTGEPTVSISKGSFKIGKNGDDKKFKFGTHVAGSNPMVPGSPPIDVFSSFSITENKKNQTLSVNGKITGDNFPSTEAFISDPAGNNVFLGIGFYEGSPFSSLDGENKRDITSFSLSIATDKDGNFTGVNFNGKGYSLGDWNKMFQQADPHDTANRLKKPEEWQLKRE